MVAMGVSFVVEGWVIGGWILGVGANRCSPLGFHHSERVFVVQPPQKPKPSNGFRDFPQIYEHVFDLGGEQAYAF